MSPKLLPCLALLLPTQSYYVLKLSLTCFCLAHLSEAKLRWNIQVRGWSWLNVLVGLRIHKLPFSLRFNSLILGHFRLRVAWKSCLMGTFQRHAHMLWMSCLFQFCKSWKGLNKLYQFTIWDARAFQFQFKFKHNPASREQRRTVPPMASCLHLPPGGCVNVELSRHLNVECYMDLRTEQGMSWANLNGFAQLLQYDRPALAKVSYNFNGKSNIARCELCPSRQIYVWWLETSDNPYVRCWHNSESRKLVWLHFCWQ